MPSRRNRAYIIAEAGVNHNGNEATAFALIDIAVAAGADAVKFQLGDADALVVENAPTAEYQAKNLDDRQISQREMIRALTLSHTSFSKLEAYCRTKNIDFLCTPFDLGSLAWLQANTSMSYMKLASGDVVNGPLLLAAARSKLSIILSTGMSNLSEIGMALSIIHFGRTHASGYPQLTPPTPAMLAELKDHVILLHCVSQYPAPIESMHLRAMDTMRETFHLPTGLSDHSIGITMPIAAVARGAIMIEKHFTYDRAARGPDHAASLLPEELAAMVKGIREVEAGLGDGTKECRPIEFNTLKVARRSIVATKSIAKGTVFTEEMLACKRPSGGLEPNQLWSLIGKSAKQTYAPDECIRAEELK